MGVFPGLDSWINLNTQQPRKAESDGSANAVSNKVQPIDPKYYDKDEVTTKKGLYHMNIEMTVGYPPEALYEMFANPNNEDYFRRVKDGRPLLKSKSRKVLKKDGPREIVELDKAVAWNFFWWSAPYPIQLIADENQKDLTGKYRKKEMMFMKVFEGSWKIEPLYVDQGRLCKSREPKSRQEYKNCSSGLGKIGTKVTMEQRFEPSSLLNLPPISWYIRETTIKTTKTLLEDFQSNDSSNRNIYKIRSSFVLVQKEMNVFPGFGSWINQNMEQPLKAESKKSENVKPKDREEMDKQGKLWRDAEKTHPWYDAPTKVKVTTKKGLCHMNIELTLGLPPKATYELFTNPNNLPLFSDKSWRQLLKNKSRKVLTEDGPRQIIKSEKAVAWNFLGFSRALPISLIADENKKDLTAKYKKEKMMYMKVFEGNWKVEPIYVDQERLSICFS
ncbi:unnamed protein product [Thlaspi arvense]|uniref:DUF220 domain-containing protein n=1 Tax=Thlaspi arvense TaxID=13288 RepID=A0AAU9R934_THLAR|nr:unnamed protein product [Thlaspi arvense]